MYNLLVVNPEKTVFKGEVKSVLAPGSLGYLEILTGHAPLITTLKKGTLTLTNSNNEKISQDISGGILEVSYNECSILVDLP